MSSETALLNAVPLWADDARTVQAPWASDAQAAVAVGASTLIGPLDYSDTFTFGTGASGTRNGTAYNAGAFPITIAPLLQLENSYSNTVRSWSSSLWSLNNDANFLSVRYSGGTQVMMHCTYRSVAHDPERWTLRLVVYPRWGGDAEEIASWTAGDGDDLTLPGYTRLSPSEIRRVEVRWEKVAVLAYDVP